MSGSEAARPPAPGPTGTPPRPRSYLAVAAALLLAVVALLGAGYLLDRQFRPRVGVQAPAATAVEATLPRPTPWPRVGRTPLEREVEDAYARYWEVRVQAYYTLDTSHLPEVMAGAELAREEKQVKNLQASGHAGKIVYDHNISFWEVAPDHAVIYDEHTSYSLFIDSVSKQEIPTHDPPELERVSYDFSKDGSAWKVVDGKIYD